MKTASLLASLLATAHGFAVTPLTDMWEFDGVAWTQLTLLGDKVAQLVADGNRVRMLAASPSSSSSASPSPAPGSDPGFYRLEALSWPEAADQVLKR